MPGAGWKGAGQPILYQVSDGNGGFSVATLLLTVNPIADAVNDSVSTHADVPVVIDALDNDSFSNSDQTITGVTAAAHGTVTIENNTLVYRPNAGYVGSDTFDYTVTSGGKTETATVTVDVTNVAPRLTSVPTISTPEDTTLNSTAAQNLLTNAHDDDGDVLAVTEFTVGGTRYLAGGLGRFDDPRRRQLHLCASGRLERRAACRDLHHQRRQRRRRLHRHARL